MTLQEQLNDATDHIAALSFIVSNLAEREFQRCPDPVAAATAASEAAHRAFSSSSAQPIERAVLEFYDQVLSNLREKAGLRAS